MTRWTHVDRRLPRDGLGAVTVARALLRARRLAAVCAAVPRLAAAHAVLALAAWGRLEAAPAVHHSEPGILEPQHPEATWGSSGIPGRPLGP